MTAKTFPPAYDTLLKRMREITYLDGAQSLLHWDESTYLPEEASDYRAEQLAYLESLRHEKFTSREIGDCLAALESAPAIRDDEAAAANVRELKRDYDRKTKLPADLVAALAKATSLGYAVWKKARAANDFKQFSPLLAEVITLVKRRGEAIGYQDDPYDAQLDLFEPQARAKDIQTLFDELRRVLPPMVAAIRETGKKAPKTILEREYPVDQQARFATEGAKVMGFDFRRGRLDITTHPFCTGLGPRDVRITTRYMRNFFNAAFFGVMHEAGHGLYEQNLPREHYGLPAGSAASMAIHESQSRFWENLIGRGRAFWELMYPKAQWAFPEALGTVALDDFYFAINEVAPSTIRVEADEVTYNLHILLRTDLELAIFHDQLHVDDIPGAWNETFQKYFGFRPPSDAEGCLQDVHWSSGLFGYFPTYAMGNMAASQFFVAADKDLGGVDAKIRAGDCKPVAEWLRTNIHQHGMKYAGADLVRRVTGKPLGVDAMMQYFRRKFGALYDMA